jgi:glycerol kinase
LCNAIVWDDARTNGVVRQFEKKLEEEGIEIDEEDEDFAAESIEAEAQMGTGTEEAAIGQQGKIHVDGEAEGIVGQVGKVMQGLGLAGRGKENGAPQRRRKGKEGLVDM